MKTRNKNLVTNPTGKYQTKLNLLEVGRNFKGMNVMENFSTASFVAIRTLFIPHLYSNYIHYPPNYLL